MKGSPNGVPGEGDRRRRGALLPVPLTTTFTRFFESEKAGGVVLVACSALALAIANSPMHESWAHFWELTLGGLTLEQWVNDGLMAVFFLLIGLELERELYAGELSSARQALLPATAALGGMAVPAMIHWLLNAGTATQGGAGIPMATDIAFAIGVLALLGARVPSSLKVFVVAFAVMDDLGAVLVIAGFYSTGLVPGYLLAAAGVLLILGALNRIARVMTLAPYLLGGALMWWLLLRSGIHPTLAGVATAFAIPFTAGDRVGEGPSHQLELALHRPVAFGILPLFALANSGLLLNDTLVDEVVTRNGLGIVLGLAVGKPVGVTLAVAIAVWSRIGALPSGMRWAHVAGAGMLGGIGFTMAIFITNLAFPASPTTVAGAKGAVFVGSLVAGCLAMAWLHHVGNEGGGPQEDVESTVERGAGG